MNLHQNFLKKLKSYIFEERRHECSAAESEEESQDIYNIADYLRNYLTDYCQSVPE